MEDEELENIEADEEVEDEDPVEEGMFDSDTSEPYCDRLGPCAFCMSPKYFPVNFRASSCATPAKAITILSGWKKVLRYFPTTFRSISGRRSSGQSRGFPKVLSLYAAICTNSGRIRSGFAHISLSSYSAVSSCCWISNSVIRGSRTVSASKPSVVGTAELKLADWYMSDSLDDAHCMFPPRLSIDSRNSSEVLLLVDLKASRSTI